jgi:lipopolysaccharide/colanic/teichoic acid biosynthesis glycosyltransferase
MENERKEDLVTRVTDIVSTVVAIWVICLIMLIPTVYILRWIF